MDHHDYLLDIAYELWLSEDVIHNHDGCQQWTPGVVSESQHIHSQQRIHLVIVTTAKQPSPTGS